MDEIKKKLLICVVMGLILSMIGGCDTSTSNTVESSSNQTDNNEKKDETQNKNIDEQVLVVDSFYRAQLSMDLDTALSYCSDSLKSDVEYVNEEFVNASDELYNETIRFCVNTAQNIFWDVADEDGSAIDASYLYEETSLIDAIKKLIVVALSGVDYELPEKADMISEDEAIVILDISSRINIDTESSWGDAIGSYVEGIVIDKFMDDAGFIKKALFKEYVTQHLVGEIDDLRAKYENANAIPSSTRTYYLKKHDNSWIIEGYEVISAKDGSVNVYGVVPGVEVEEYDEFDEDTYYNDEYYDNDNSDEEDDYYDDDYDQSNYILPYSSTDYLDEEDIEDLSAMELTYARNEIYARHGYVFKADELNEYFQNMDWYESDYDYDGSLSEIEEYNAELIKSYQNENDLMYVPE